MAFDVRAVNLDALNSMTKYPSIPTYHQIDPSNGSLSEPCVRFTGPVIATEKLDGTNARVIALPDGTYVLGSREELLYGTGDLIINPFEGVVDALRPFADAMKPVPDVIRVYYVEVYGGKIGGKVAKRYTSNRTVGVRLFDVVEYWDHETVLAWPVERIASWRQAGHQPYVPERRLMRCGMDIGILLTPALFEMDGADLPTGIDEMQEFLTQHLPTTQCGLDPETAGPAEGVVLRTPDRQIIAKARHEDYARTIRRREAAEKVLVRQ